MAAFYVAVMPVLFSLLYAFSCTEPFRYHESRRWIPIKLNFRGLFLLLLLCFSLIGVDRVGFHYFAPRISPPETFLADLFNTVWILLLAGAMAVFIDGVCASREEHARKAREAQYALSEATGRLVVAQLDPHCMRNVMANVAALIRRDPDRGALMLEAAGFFTGRILESTRTPRIALWQEREIIEDFLSVEAIRMGDRLKVEWDWSEAFDDVTLPPVLIQPLVDNAIKHGVWPCQGGGTVHLTTRQEGRALEISVRNTGEPLARDSRPGSTGLENLRHRLSLEYGVTGHFSITSDGLWTVATVTIPLETACA
jgi:LytS/YehU family sensor histidine kinase